MEKMIYLALLWFVGHFYQFKSGTSKYWTNTIMNSWANPHRIYGALLLKLNWISIQAPLFYVV